MSLATHPLIDPVPLTLPDLPAALSGLRIAHLTDLHVSRPRPRFKALLRAVEAIEADLVLLTGDYMNDAGQEPAAMMVLRDICQRLRPRLGTFGVFGNHDTHILRQLAHDLPVRWLHNEAAVIADGAIEILGFENEKHHWPDAVKLMAQIEPVQSRTISDNTLDGDALLDDALPDGALPDDAHLSRTVRGARPRAVRDAHPPAAQLRGPRPLRLLLSHYPTMLPVASELNIDIMFSGHTHGGQWRLPRRLALYTSCDLPSHLCAGVLRHRDTLAVISRGLGETFVPLRILCPPHLPIFHLTRGPLPGTHTPHLENVKPW